MYIGKLKYRYVLIKSEHATLIFWNNYGGILLDRSQEIGSHYEQYDTLH